MAINAKHPCYLAFFADKFCRFAENVYLCAPKQVMKEIRHDGIIESIGRNGHVRVRITQMAACAGCKVATHCNASEQKVKVVDVYHCEQTGINVGDSVVVAASQAAVGHALLLAFGLPLLLLLVVLAAMLTAGVDEGTSALAALAVLTPYYLIIWLCRNHIAGKISFRIITNK
jgi:sigma-E factor negative regulatory protein RseC